MPLIMNLRNLQQENGMLLMTKIMEKMAKEVKMIHFETKVIKSSLCDYSDTYILVRGNIKVADVGANTNVAFEIVLYLQDV